MKFSLCLAWQELFVAETRQSDVLLVDFNLRLAVYFMFSRSFRHVMSLYRFICLPSSVDSSTVFCLSFLTFISQPCAIFAIVTVAAARRANIKEHQPGWGDDALSDFAIGQTELPDCLIIPTFPGRYPIADHPGACCRTDDRMWSCWAD